MSERFADILNECIDRLLQGESMEQCLQRYPEQAAELEPLLQVALETQKVSAIEPRPEFKAKAREQLRSVLYSPKPETQRSRGSLWDSIISGISGIIAGFWARPVYQKAIAGAMVLVLAIGLTLAIPSLWSESSVALAEETALNDPGVQILLAEKGFQPSDVNKVAVYSGTDNIYYVQFMSPTDGLPVGTVTVNVKERVVTHIGMHGSSEEFTRPPGHTEGMNQESILQIAERDSRVHDILNSGATVGRMSPLTSSEKSVVGLELRSGNTVWVVRIDMTEEDEGEVTNIFQK